MTVALMTRLVHEQIKPKIGSRILNNKEELLRGGLADQLNELLEQRGVLVFPEIYFTDDEQVAFTNALGGNAPEMRGEAVFKISLDRAINREAVEYLKGSLFWHIDGTTRLRVKVARRYAAANRSPVAGKGRHAGAGEERLPGGSLP